jgi:hypothetical protein
MRSADARYRNEGPLYGPVIWPLVAMCVLASCIDPQCPRGKGKVGDTCYRLAGEAGTRDASDEAGDGRVESSSEAEDVGSSVPPCDCPDPAKPVCLDSDGMCVACTEAARGACHPDQFCDVASGTCADCLEDGDCENPSASACDVSTHRCRPCVEGNESDCSHIEGKHVCLAGECVQCTKNDLSACLVLQTPTRTVQNACHALTHACVDRQLGKTPPCGECVSDAECESGHVCMVMNFAGQPIAGCWYCLPLLEGLNCARGRPFVTLPPPARTIDGVSADVCARVGDLRRAERLP